jgi:hypothetical protein
VSPALAQRQVALGAIALLAAVVALAIASHGSSNSGPTLPQPAVPAGGAWYSALAGATLPHYGRRTRCGIVLEPGTIGVTDSVLPCGIRLFVVYQDSPEVLTQVIDRRPVASGRKFELTPRLAETLGIDGVQRIRWVFAR